MLFQSLVWEDPLEIWEDPLEKEMTSIPVFLPGKSPGQRSLVCYSPWGCRESDTTEQPDHKDAVEHCEIKGHGGVYQARVGRMSTPPPREPLLARQHVQGHTP